MPKVHKLKARKDYPNEGIKKGDYYWKTKLRTGPASGTIVRFAKPPLPSQLTRSPFQSAVLGAQEAWEASDKDAEAIRAAEEVIREQGEECQNNFDNMPEGLQNCENGERLENRATECERIADELNTLADELEELSEPEEFDDEPFDPGDYAEEVSGMDPEDVGEFLAEKEQEHLGRIDDAEEEHDHYHTELARITEEVDALLGDLPE